MKLYFMLAFARKTSPPNPVLSELFTILRKRGFEIEIGIAEDVVMQPERLTVEHDLYILKSHTALWLSLAGILHSQGACLLNPYPACLATYNKIVSARLMHAADVPIPRSWVTGDLNLLCQIADTHPLLIKPYIGGRGVGIQIVHNARELAAVPSPQQPVLVQEYLSNSHQEIKVYVIGQEVFGIRKIVTGGETVYLTTAISDEVRTIALQCGQVFGLGLYGLDVIECAKGPVVIDVNYFPSYKGVPNAAPLIARYIEEYADARYAELVPSDDATVAYQYGATSLVADQSAG